VSLSSEPRVLLKTIRIPNERMSAVELLSSFRRI